MSRLFQRLSVLVFIFLVVSVSQAQTIDQYLEVFMNKTNTSQRSDHRQLLLELTPGVKKEHLNKAEIDVKRFLGKNHIIIESEQLPLIKELTVQHWAINEHWKLSDKLLFQKYQPATVIVRTETDNLLEPGWVKLKSNLYQVDPQQHDIESLLSNDLISYIGDEQLTPKTESRVLDLNLNPNKVNLVHNLYPDLNGMDIVVSIQEQAYDVDDIDLKDRNLPSSLSSSNQDLHATEMATIIGGAGNSFVTGKGVANAVTMTSSDFADVLPDDDDDYSALNAYVQNHSYGTEVENFYGGLAEAYDQSTNNNLQLLHVFSAGNAGQSTASSGKYAGINGYANLTGNFKQSKNTLVIGSVDTVNIQPNFVSNGPAYDGRVKPELVAYGVVGSSNSAALTSGLLALLQQQHTQDQGTLPASALLKAILINAAEDVGAVGLDYKTGYGNINAHSSIEQLIGAQYFSGSISTGEQLNFDIIIPTNAVNLKITLVWNDPASTINSTRALVNDLDLQFSDGTMNFLPWVLNDDQDGLNDLPMRKKDDINNVEQITIADPQMGSQQITVAGFDIPIGPQEFYIVYDWEEQDDFLWTFPTSSDNMPYNGETTGYFRWETTYTGTAILEYSIDKGVSWQLINNNVDLSKEYFRWHPPTDYGSALARITVGSESFITDEFAISKTSNTKIGLNCGDSILVQWNRDPSAIEYELSKIGDSPYLEKILTTSDTSVIIFPSQLNSNLFSIKPVYKGFSKPVGSPTFDFNLLGANCFINSFDATMKDEEILLTLQLDVEYGVSKISFERLDPTLNKPLSAITQSDLLITAVDAAPVEGLNSYRVKIGFQNGSSLVSDTLEVYYLNTKKAFVFPNPVTSEDFLKVYTKNFVGEPINFQLINRSGQTVFSQTLFSDRNLISLPILPTGIYLYILNTPDGNVSGKLLILE